jgi:Tat protein translocase TatB subunit
MGSIGPAEVLVVLVAALIILGPKRLPEAARQLGKALAEFRRVSSDLQAEVRDAFVVDHAALPNVDDTAPPHGDPLATPAPDEE